VVLGEYLLFYRNTTVISCYQKYGKRPALIYGYCLLTESFFFFVLFLITLVYLLLFEEKTSVLSLEVMVLFGWMLALVDAILYIRYKRTPEQYSDLENKLPILKILSNYFS
jgi:hypothetical protein